MKRKLGGSVGKGKRQQRRMHKEEGSVTIFLIMVLAFVFLFSAVLIDYARIAAVNVQGERLARAGVRSVMSAYNIELQQKYGLFAYGNSDANQLLSRTLNDNLHKSGRGDTFNILPLALESSSLDLTRPLGEYDIFRRQISEEMKYKAPVDFALELAGKFKPLSSAMAEASRATEVLSKLQPLYDQREEALDLVLDRRSRAAQCGEELLELIMNPPRESINPSSIGNPSTAADIAAQYDDYVYKYEADLFRDSKYPPKYTYQLALYTQKSAAVISRLPLAAEAYREEHSHLMQQAREALKRAEDLNGQMKLALEQSRSNEAGQPDPASTWDIPGTAERMDAEPLRKLREQEDALILLPESFLELEKNQAAQESAYELVQQEAAVLPGVLAEAGGLNGSSANLIAAVLRASQTTGAYLHNYGKGGVKIAGEAAALEEHRSSDKQRKQLEKQAKTKLGEAMGIVDSIRQLNEQAGESLEQFAALRKYAEEIASLNEGLAQAEPEATNKSTDPYTAGSSAMTNIDGVYSAMGSIMDGARDRLFQTEYSALYFQHFDFSKLAAGLSGEEGSFGGQLADQLDPQAQELEYILYGFYNPAGNVAAAYGEIFAIRLAIRTMEGFIKEAGLGNPLVVLAAALLYGIEQAVRDMLMLGEKGSIPLSAYMPAPLTYRDHLRLFMLLHGGGEVQLSRMLALMRLNTGINPADTNTYAASDIKLRMRLWFLPGVIQLLNYTGAVSGEVQGNTYVRAIRADFSY
ncbi:hypothetical protein J7E73_25080 [Paenibacillus albidus]|uniref:hypothetical protein n=1 Tax=Paenibacillus albidus TaxID=2041023 RepID=UPI001BEC68AC|nr:hypothetical protein [Paenibacillus albidus]MBT2292343.1 hypothetical protein [Paenibacillus albidus]